MFLDFVHRLPPPPPKKASRFKNWICFRHKVILGGHLIYWTAYVV
jgi:hypothetical protein